MAQIPVFTSTADYAAAPLPTMNPAAASQATDALAAGMGRVTNEFAYVSRVAAHQYAASSAVQATGQFRKELTDLQSQFSQDPDPATAAQRFDAQAQALAKTHIDAQPNEMVRGFMQNHFAQIAPVAYAEVSRQAAGAVKQQGIGVADAALSDASKSMSGAGTEADLLLAQQSAKQALASVQATNAITPEQARMALSGAYQTAILTRATADPAGAANLLDRFAPEMDASHILHVRQTLVPALNKAEIGAAVQVAMGGADPTRGAAGGVALVGAGQVPESLVNNVKQWEGFTPTATPDGTQISNGYGTAAGYPGETIDQTEADKRLRAELAASATKVDKATTAAGLALSQNQRAAMISFNYNTGAATSVLAQAAGDASKLPGLMADYIHQNGKEVPGLVNRRANEAALFNADGPAPLATSQPGRVVPTQIGFQPVSQTPGQPSYADVAPNLDDWVARAQAQFPDDPAKAQLAVAGVTAKWHQWHSATANQRAELGKELINVQAALADGRDAPIPSDAIHRLLPADQAADVLSKLDDAQKDGLVMTQVRLADPSELGAMRALLAKDAGPVPPGGSSEVDLSNYAQRSRALARFDRAANARQTAINQDPAAYVQQAPSVATARAALASGQPGAQEAYATAMLAEQTRLGVRDDDQHVLTQDEANTLAGQLRTADVTTTNPAQHLATMAQTYGAAWPKVWGDLVTLGKVAPEWQVAATIKSPAVQQDYVRTLQAATKKGGLSKVEADMEPQTMQQIKQALPDAMAPFRQTASVDGVMMNLEQMGTYTNAVKQLAMGYAVQGLDGTTAVQKAVQGILGDRYDFDGTMRVPKGTMPAVQSAIDTVRANLKPSDLAPLPSSGDATIDANRQAALGRTLGSMFWVTNKSDDGLVAYIKPKDGSILPVKLRNGQTLEVKFNALPTTVPTAWPGATDLGSSMP